MLASFASKLTTVLAELPPRHRAVAGEAFLYYVDLRMSIQVLAHRGIWRDKGEQNSFVALARALDAGFGLETDLRDHNQDLVISHDPPTGQSWPLISLLEYYESSHSQSWLAFNIKADGLTLSLVELLSHFRLRNYFVFDMSVPDSLQYVRQQVPFFSRQSELEPEPVLYEQADGVWLDAFQHEWYAAPVFEGHLDRGKHVALVSPELHGRPHLAAWKLLLDLPCPPSPHLMLCTDHPHEFMQMQGS